MRNACVNEEVRQSVVSRRSLSSGAAAAGLAAVAAGITMARPALAQASGKAADLTHPDDGSFPAFDDNPGILDETAVDFATNGYQLYKSSIFDHTGTHIGAPLHFSADGGSVDVLPPERLVCPPCVIDLTAKARDDANAMVEPADIEVRVSANRKTPAGSCVAMNSGRAAKVGSPDDRNTPEGAFAIPCFSKAATDMLAGFDVAAIEVDALSLDPGNSVDFAVHSNWLPGGRFGIGNMANLDQMPARGATVFVGAPTHKGGTGGPARILAVM